MSDTNRFRRLVPLIFALGSLTSCLLGEKSEPPRACALNAYFLPPSIEDSAKILVQEYWEEGEARYLVFNLNPEARTLWVYESGDLQYEGCTITGHEPGTLLAGPWEVPALSSRIFEAHSLEAPTDRNYGGNLALYIGSGESIGGLPRPIRPEFSSPPPALAVAAPGNGYPWGSSRLTWEEVSGLVVDTDTLFETHLSLPGDFSYVQISKDISPWHQPLARHRLIDACSAELRVVELADEIWIFRDGATTSGRFKVKLTWRSPDVIVPTLAQLPISFCAPTGDYDCDRDYPPVAWSDPALLVMP